jgi:hypothetical protein
LTIAIATSMQPSNQSWLQEEDSQDVGRLHTLQRLTSSSRMIHQSIDLPSIPLRSPQNIAFQKNKENPITTIDVIDQVLELLETDDDDWNMFVG